MQHDIRNARRKLNGDIDLELRLHGNWLPFTARKGEAGLAGEAWLQADPIAAAADGAAEAAAELAATRAAMVVSRFQARAALMDAGLLADVELAIAASADPLIQLAWAEATEFHRASPTIAQLAAVLALPAEQVDDLFITASKISA